MVMFSNAVNMPSIDADSLNKIKPYLKARGRPRDICIAQLLDEPLTGVEVQYNGEVAEQRIDPIHYICLKRTSDKKY